MDFESELSNVRIGGKQSNKQANEIENITNLYGARKRVITLRCLINGRGVSEIFVIFNNRGGQNKRAVGDFCYIE